MGHFLHFGFSVSALVYIDSERSPACQKLVPKNRKVARFWQLRALVSVLFSAEFGKGVGVDKMWFVWDVGFLGTAATGAGWASPLPAYAGSDPPHPRRVATKQLIFQHDIRHVV